MGDGAAWVWNVAAEVCPDGRPMVDWFHAVHHLAQAANVLDPDDPAAVQRQAWLETHSDPLSLGRIHNSIAALHQRDRADLAGYFETHQRRMQELEFREAGFPMGSGTVASGVKQFKQRLTGTGMRWNADHAHRRLVIRAAILGPDFSALWADSASSLPTI
jgi:hypothetical protein